MVQAEVADLREQVKAAGSTYFHKFEGQLQIYEDAMDGLKETLQTIAQCTRNNDGEGIPERAAINQTQVASELGHYEEDVGKSLRSLASHTQQAKVTGSARRWLFCDKSVSDSLPTTSSP